MPGVGGGPTAGRFAPCDAERPGSRPGAGGGVVAAAIFDAFVPMLSSVSAASSLPSEAGTGSVEGARGGDAAP